MNSLLHLKSDQFKFRDVLENLDNFLTRQGAVLDQTAKELDSCSYNIDEKLTPIIAKLDMLTEAVSKLTEIKDQTEVTDFHMPLRPPRIYITPPEDEIIVIDDDDEPVSSSTINDDKITRQETIDEGTSRTIITISKNGCYVDKSGWQYIIHKKLYKNGNFNNNNNISETDLLTSKQKRNKIKNSKRKLKKRQSADKTENTIVECPDIDTMNHDNDNSASRPSVLSPIQSISLNPTSDKKVISGNLRTLKPSEFIFHRSDSKRISIRRKRTFEDTPSTTVMTPPKPYFYNSPLVKKYREKYDSFVRGDVLNPKAPSLPISFPSVDQKLNSQISAPLFDPTVPPPPLPATVTKPIDLSANDVPPNLNPRPIPNFTMTSINKHGTYHLGRLHEEKIRNYFKFYLGYFHDHPKEFVGGFSRQSLLFCMQAEGFGNIDGHFLSHDQIQNLYFDYGKLRGVPECDMLAELRIVFKHFNALKIQGDRICNENFRRLYMAHSKDFCHH
jgi:hypothetical protein